MPDHPLLLVPGLNCTDRAFAGLLPRLWPLASLTIANHQRGDSMAAIAQAILAEAPPRFALLGFSMGGYIAFEILRQAPERVTRLCCLSTSARLDSGEAAENRRRMIGLAEAGKFAQVPDLSFERAVHPDHVGDAALERLHRDMALDAGANAYVAHQTAILNRPDSRPLLPKITAPTRVIVGEADMVTGVEAAREIADGVPDARFDMIAGAGHLAPLEQPQAVSAAVADWLTSPK